jgi:NADPH:quinone reductase-like Zn-dependent oxidoreductase
MASSAIEPTAMKAIVQQASGSPEVLRLREVAKPQIADDRVLVRVRAASVNALDWHTVHGGSILRLVALVMRSKPNPIRGVDVAGVVEAAGANVTKFRPGDEVFGVGQGTFAEYATGSERGLIAKPPQLSFAHAAAIGVAGVTALQGVRDRGRVRSGQRVLIHGAGGGVGTFAVQIAKALGAEVTAVTSTRNMEVVGSLAPDALINYEREDFTRRAERYDLIFDVAATRSFEDMHHVLAPDGRIVLAGAAKTGAFLLVLARALGGIVRARLGARWLVPFLAQTRAEDLATLRDLVVKGQVRPVIDRTFPLSDVAEAVRYVGSGQARAKVVIEV